MSYTLFRSISVFLIVFLSLTNLGFGYDATNSELATEILSETNFSGGLIVHLGCGDGHLTAELRQNDRFLVHGLDTEEANVQRARTNVTSQGKYGPVAIDRFDGTHLPYVDNLVNLLVVSNRYNVRDDEIRRVLAPLGVARIKTRDGWQKITKPWPADIDQWTHFLHGPNNNAVASDRVVGPPSHLKWLADPIHLRSHEHLNSVTSLVSTGGRIFYIIDEGPTSSVAAQPQWRLVARDAFNGLLLWKQEIGPWEGHFRVFRSGPTDVARRLVAVDGLVFVTLGYEKKVAAFDAVTGKQVHIYDETDGAVEIICNDGKLFVVFGDIDLTPPADPAKIFYPPPAPRKKGIVALDAISGRVLWKHRNASSAEIMPCTLAADTGKVFYQNTTHVVCLDANTGETLWQADRPVYTNRLSWSTSTLVVKNGVVLSADGPTVGSGTGARRGESSVEWVMSDRDIRKHPIGDLVALSAEDGSLLWTGRSLQGFCNPGDLFVIDNKVFCGADVGSGQALLNMAVDLKSGKVVHNRPKNGMPVGGHTKCYRNKATERFLVMGDLGVEFVNVDDWSWNGNPWVRGTCQYGIMPCNGLLYAPPDSCACRPEMRLHGFAAMAPKSESPRPEPADPLRRGPAYDEFQTRTSRISSPNDWPTYRHDIARSGRTDAIVPADLQPLWETEIGNTLSSVTIADGKLLVADVDTHRVLALNATTGEIVWTFIAGGKVDSPPTAYNGMAVFGCHDGLVYCVKLDDGKLIWRFRAAPEDRRIIAMENVESAWPVHGSVLIRDDKVWFAAGRSPFLDRGIHLYSLNAQSGKVVAKQTIFSRGTQQFNTSKPQAPTGTTTPGMPDILTADDDLVFMRWKAFDREANIVKVQPHLFSATGFLDDTWWHRTYWQWGTWMSGGFGGWPRAAQQVPAGRIMVIDEKLLYSFARAKYDAGNGGNVSAGHIGVVKQDYQDSGLVAPDKNPMSLYAAIKPDPARPGNWRKTDPIRWQASLPILVRAMIKADRTLFVAGPDAGQNNSGLANLRTSQPGALWSISADDGSVISKYPLPAAPIFDGMAAADGKLYLSTMDGKVRCLGKK